MQTPFKGNIIIVGVLVLAIILGGVWYFVQRSNSEKAMTASSAEKTPSMPEQKPLMEGKPALPETPVQPAGDAAMKEKSMAEETTGAMSAGGTYVSYSADKLGFAQTGKVVLFFRASWCPTCRAVDADIRSNLSAIPKNLIILDVNYDEAKDLKTRYAITAQHTFVQVNATGEMLSKWSGSSTLADIVKRVQ